MSSSSFTCIASVSRFCVHWMRKTMRNVTIVVAVLITSCQVSLNPKIGPETPQTTMIATAAMNVTGLPVLMAVHLAKRENSDLGFVGFICSSVDQNITASTAAELSTDNTIFRRETARS